LGTCIQLITLAKHNLTKQTLSLQTQVFYNLITLKRFQLLFQSKNSFGVDTKFTGIEGTQH